jgi:hypothetical protein
MLSSDYSSNPYFSNDIVKHERSCVSLVLCVNYQLQAATARSQRSLHVPRHQQCIFPFVFPLVLFENKTRSLISQTGTFTPDQAARDAHGIRRIECRRSEPVSDARHPAQELQRERFDGNKHNVAQIAKIGVGSSHNDEKLAPQQHGVQVARNPALHPNHRPHTRRHLEAINVKRKSPHLQNTNKKIIDFGNEKNAATTRLSLT